MEKHNIFVVGPEVSGESMIGYNYHLDYLVDVIKNTSTNISVTGLKRSGKTSLVKEAIRRIEAETEKIIFLKIDLAKYKLFSEFLSKILKSLKRQVKKRTSLSDNEEIIEKIQQLEDMSTDEFMFREDLSDLFLDICDQDDEYKIVLMIDEFDEAVNIFKDTSDYELLRNWASDGDMRFSLLLVSRRQVYMIEKRNFNNSTFHGIINSYAIKGFENEDIDAYFRVLKDYEIELSPEQIKRIRYYAGKSPYVWSMFGYCIVESKRKNSEKEIDIDEIFIDKKAVDLNDHFKAVYHNLTTDNIYNEKISQEMSSVDKLSAVIFGPKLGITWEDINILKILGYLDETQEGYYSVSGYFTEYIKNKYSSTKNSMFEGIINVEKKTKAILNNNLMNLIDFYQISGNSINELQKSILQKTEGINESAVRRYDSYIINNKRVFKQESTYFDVMSLKDAVRIIKNCWQSVFCKYFNDDDYEVWKDMFAQTGNARNPVAHGHEEFLTEDDKKIIDVYCKKINNQLTDANINSIITDLTSDDDLISYSKKYDIKISKVHVDEILATDDVTVFIGESKGTNKNLKGRLESGEAGSIKGSFFYEIGCKPYDFYGKEIPVKIISQNPQGNGYILEPVVSLESLLHK